MSWNYSEMTYRPLFWRFRWITGGDTSIRLRNHWKLGRLLIRVGPYTPVGEIHGLNVDAYPDIEVRHGEVKWEPLIIGILWSTVSPAYLLLAWVAKTSLSAVCYSICCILTALMAVSNFYRFWKKGIY